jgi:hypothetical protein
VASSSFGKRLRDQCVEGIGEIADQSYGPREFVAIDPDGDNVRVGSATR